MKENIYLGVKGALATAGAFLSAKLGLLFPVLMLLTVLMVVDFISGMAASIREALENPQDKTKGLASKKGLLGILKKVGYMLCIAVAMSIDWIIINTAGQIGVSVPTVTFFGLLTAVWFILNELLSILENAGRLGTKLPKFLKDIITVLKNGVENKGGDSTSN